MAGSVLPICTGEDSSPATTTYTGSVQALGVLGDHLGRQVQTGLGRVLLTV
jgi:hypothetical protein